MPSLIARLPGSFLWRLRQPLPKHGLILDAGCGDGGMAFHLKRPGQRLVGLDIDAHRVTNARAQRTHASVAVGSIERLPFPDGAFDGVACLEVIEHLPKPDARHALEEIIRVSRGPILVTTPNGVGAEPAEAPHDFHQRHKSEWSANDLRALGFSVSGLGLRWVWAPGGWGRKPGMPGAVARVVSAVLSPWIQGRPERCAGLLAVRSPNTLQANRSSSLLSKHPSPAENRLWLVAIVAAVTTLVGWRAESLSFGLLLAGAAFIAVLPDGTKMMIGFGLLCLAIGAGLVAVDEAAAANRMFACALWAFAFGVVLRLTASETEEKEPHSQERRRAWYR